MGQDQQPPIRHNYNSQQYFQQQVQFYRWRADPNHNSHICKVAFHLQQSIRDRQTLQQFLEVQFTKGNYIALNDILRLANTQSKVSKEELMTFQNYVCTLADLEERLTFEQTLYTLQTLFNGFETLLNKLGKLKVKLEYCFVTEEGEVRAWFIKDFKSNQQSSDIKESSIKNPVIGSQVAMIKKILELGEKLSSKHTEFLHFNRQFRSYMERDILQNWNFANARKLINSYIYTYRLTLPSNLKSILKKLQQSRITSSISSSNVSKIDQPSFFHINSASKKHVVNSTADPYSNPNSGRKDYQKRPASFSDFSSKKSQQSEIFSLKSHSKKFSSTDLRVFNPDKIKKYQSSKINRSQTNSFQSNKSQHKRKQKHSLQNSSFQDYKNKQRQRQLAFADGYDFNKANTTQACSPKTQLFTQGDVGGFQEMAKQQNDKFSMKENNPSILKHHQKQKKKLQKKAAVVSKYMSFCQQTKKEYLNDMSSPELTPSAVQEVQEQRYSQPKSLNFGGQENIPQINVFEEYSIDEKVTFAKRPISQPQHDNYLPSQNHSRMTSIQNTHKNSNVFPAKMKTQYFQHFRQESQKQESYISSSKPQGCVTIKTFNKLIDNKEISLQQSQGSFTSVQRSQASQYQGVLSKMGRSVDIMQLDSNRHILQKKPLTTVSNFNRTFNN